MNQLATVDGNRSEVFNLEQRMQQGIRDQTHVEATDLTVKHIFLHRTYARELTIPAGRGLTGAVQKYALVNILSEGEITVLTANGIMERVKAPWQEITPAGTKRIGRTHTKCVWTTFYPTDDTDVDRIVAAFTTNDEAEYLAFRKSLLLEGE